MNITCRGSQGALRLRIDSTGIKVEGEGNRMHVCLLVQKRRIWRKVHLGIDEKTLEIRAVEFTSSDLGDASILPNILGLISPDQEIGSVTADGAYDPRKCHDDVASRSAQAIIPTR